MRQAAAVSEPALEDEYCIENDDCHCRASNEERLQSSGANVRDVGDMLVGAHARVVWFSVCYPYQHHGKECRCMRESVWLNHSHASTMHLPNQTHAANSGKTQYDMPNMIDYSRLKFARS